MAALALDIGATKLAVAVVDPDGSVLRAERTPTRRDEGPDAVLERLFALADRLLAGTTPEAVGIACGGPLDARTGVLLGPLHLPGWHHVEIVRLAGDRFDAPAVLVNDASAGAWGEFRAGAAQGAGSELYLTVSSGLGGGAVLDGRLLGGATTNGGEFGHVCVRPGGRRCTCGRLACAEAYVAGTQLVERAREALAAGRASALADVPDLDARAIVHAAASDGLAGELWADALDCLGQLVIDLVNVLEPEVVVLDGGADARGRADRRRAARGRPRRDRTDSSRGPDRAGGARRRRARGRRRPPRAGTGGMTGAPLNRRPLGAAARDPAVVLLNVGGMPLADRIVDLLASDPGEVAVQPPGEGDGFWAGGPSVVFEDGVFWLAYRLRRPVDQGRGYANVVARSEDGVRFEPVATITAAQFGSASLERPALIRRPDGGWRIYISCSTEGSKHWWVEALDADTPEGLPTGTRTMILPGDETAAWKDVVVHRDGDAWSMWACRHPLDGGDDEADRMTSCVFTSTDGLHWSDPVTALAPAPEGWDRRGRRLTSVVAGDTWTAFYDGRASAAENWYERTAGAVGDGPEAFLPVTGPTPPGRTLRYLSIATLPDAYRLYWEASREDGANELRTQAIPA